MSILYKSKRLINDNRCVCGSFPHTLTVASSIMQQRVRSTHNEKGVPSFCAATYLRVWQHLPWSAVHRVFRGSNSDKRSKCLSAEARSIPAQGAQHGLAGLQRILIEHNTPITIPSHHIAVKTFSLKPVSSFAVQS